MVCVLLEEAYFTILRNIRFLAVKKTDSSKGRENPNSLPVSIRVTNCDSGKGHSVGILHGDICRNWMLNILPHLVTDLHGRQNYAAE